MTGNVMSVGVIIASLAIVSPTIAVSPIGRVVAMPAIASPMFASEKPAP